MQRVLDEIPVELVQAALFGSAARGEARPDSDVDILLVFAWLPDDREPFAGDAERIAEEVAAASRVPVTVWSVSLVDLERGNRTPMLVDALDDAIPVWVSGAPLPAVPFTADDALRCTEALLLRIDEGSDEFSSAMHEGRWDRAVRRARDDIVRACTALLLLRGITRPRRADAVRWALREEYGSAGAPCWLEDVLVWSEESFGENGRGDTPSIPLPPFGPSAFAAAIDHLHARIIAGRNVLRGQTRPGHSACTNGRPRRGVIAGMPSVNGNGRTREAPELRHASAGIRWE